MLESNLPRSPENKRARFAEDKQGPNTEETPVKPAVATSNINTPSKKNNHDFHK